MPAGADRMSALPARRAFMKDNYLWDRSGEPDPELQKLEDILGSLKYQPRQLAIPADIRVGHRRSFFPPLAIAAAIGMLAIILGLWFQFNRKPGAPQREARQDSPVKQNTNDSQPVVAQDKEPSQAAAGQNLPNNPRLGRAPQNLVATNKRRPIRKETSEPELTPQELAEKEQVVTALRLVSAKLNLAQRRTQGTPPANIIRNQHKIG